MVRENRLEVKATDGTVSVVALDDKTRVLRGTARAKPGTVKTANASW